ncbi:MAG: hypothetical protein HYS38_06680 [Acidobacteria bacterium]|nr:hypothetical protein [Acidobacteriota bacterium]
MPVLYTEEKVAKNLHFVRQLTMAFVVGIVAATMIVRFVLVADAQTQKVPCYSGASDPSCTPAQRSAKAKALAKAKTAAVIIEATKGISCGDGSGACITTDSGGITIIQQEVEASELWKNLTKAEAKKADILLKFNTSDRESLQLCAYDADSNDLLWCDYRNPSIALDNDSSREIVHFLDAWRASQK